MRVLVCGDRNWTDAVLMQDRLSQLPVGTVIVHGDCRGADRIAGNVAEFLGMEVEKYPAEWNKYGKSAGPIRNREMLDTQPNMVIAFHDDLAKSKGTKDCVTEARKRNITVEVIGH